MKLLVLLMLPLFLTFTLSTSANNETYNLVNYSTNLAKPFCESRCGDLIVPYPFGLNSNCSIGKRFVIYCNKSLNPASPSFTRTGYNSIKLISDSTLRITNLVERTCKFLDGSNSSIAFSFNFTRWPYTISTVNKFTVLGCDGSAWLTSRTKDKNLYTGCMVFCSRPEEVGDADCTGNGCCRSSISQDINYYTTRISSLRNSSEMTDKSLFAPCTYAFLGDPSVLKFKGAVDLKDISFKDRIESDVPIVLDWAIGTMSCAEANGTNDFACQANSTCVDSSREAGGYRCECKQGYEGNPYLYPGCQGKSHRTLFIFMTAGGSPTTYSSESQPDSATCNAWSHREGKSKHATMHTGDQDCINERVRCCELLSGFMITSSSSSSYFVASNPKVTSSVPERITASNIHGAGAGGGH